MKLRWLFGVAAAAAMIASGPSARAADHLDGPAVQVDKATDITDTYGWMQGGKLVLVMNVHPLADGTSSFSDAAYYVFHVNSMSAYGMVGTETTIICAFDAAQAITCWPGDDEAEIVQGDASATAGLASTSGKFKVFAGRREDPFFFNLVGFREVRDLVLSVAGVLVFDAAGCPDIDSTNSAAIVAQLGQNDTGQAGTDFFGSLNVMSIIVEVDVSLINEGGPILGYWASTHAQ